MSVWTKVSAKNHKHTQQQNSYQKKSKENAGVDLQNDEELVSWLSLDHNLLAVLKLNRLQGVSYCEPLPLIQRF